MKAAAFQAEEQRKQAAFEAEQQRKTAALGQDVDRKDAQAGIDPTTVKQAAEFIAQTGIQMSPRELAVLSKTLGKSFADTVAAISRMAMQGQGGTQFNQTADFHNNAQRFR